MSTRGIIARVEGDGFAGVYTPTPRARAELFRLAVNLLEDVDLTDHGQYEYARGVVELCTDFSAMPMEHKSITAQLLGVPGVK